MVTNNERKILLIIEEIGANYDPENDMGNPNVSYTEKRLLDAIEILVQHIGARDQAVTDLINHINGMEQDITRLQQELKAIR